MKTVRLTCKKCNATLQLAKYADSTRLFCPYCGSSTTLLVESDQVKLALIRAEAELDQARLQFSAHRDAVDEARTCRRIQIGFICAFALITLILAVIWLA